MCEYGGTMKKLCNNDKCNKCFELSFASYEKAKFWSNKNELKPRQVFKSSHKKFIFDCDKCDHEFEMSLNGASDKNRNRWCQYCSNQKLCNDDECKDCLNKSFKSNEKSKFWSDKNELKPRQVFKSSHKKYYFECDKCNHTFESGLNKVTNAGSWCHYCVNNLLCNDDNCKTCFNKSFASSNKSKFWSDKNKIKPRDVFKSSSQKYYFNCNKCDHEFESTLNNITNNHWCGYCSNDLLCNDDKCKICYNKSFASSSKSKFWSDKNEVKPRDVFKSSNCAYKFNCDKCNHEFESQLDVITRDHWCPFCTNKQLCDNKKCDLCFDKSFAAIDKSKYWSAKNELKPRDVFKSTDQKFYFNCDKCNHKFVSQLSSITAGKWCIFCANLKLCGNIKCDYCINKTFSKNEKSKYWSDKNELKPEEVFMNSQRKYIFNCNLCNNEYIATLNSININNTWCSCTNNKTETILFDWLKENYKNVEKQKKFEWCKNQTYLPFDFCLEDYKILIELDGEQHFKQISNWDPPEKINKNDKYKMDIANKHNYSIIRIYQPDVFNNKNDWKCKLENSIKKYKKIINIFIGEIYNNSNLNINSHN